VLKTDVRVIAATNVNLFHAVSKGKFRQDLYYRLNAVNIMMPALRERPQDINLLFRKFASDFAVKYGFAKVSLTEDASIMLRKYRWPGNIRQLKNVAEAISALESGKMVSGSDRCTVDVDVLSGYIPREEPNLLPAVTASAPESPESAAEREAIIRSIFQLKQDVEYLKDILAKAGLTRSSAPAIAPPEPSGMPVRKEVEEEVYDYDDPEDQEYDLQAPEDMSIKTANLELIEKVLRKHEGNRKAAAAELGISERTLYRKLKQIR
jgi:DNA-binding NtrC family response regulator